MKIRSFWALIAPVTCGSRKPGKTLARSGIALVHLAAAGLATAIFPIASCVVAIIGMALYMRGAQQTMQAAESTKQIFRA